MRMETFIRKGLRLKAHRVVTIEEDDAAAELVIHLDRRDLDQLGLPVMGEIPRARR